MDRDFYGILNIPRDASKDEVREAYLRLARQYHPDLSKKSDSREQFEEINQAYTILSDDESRTVYNHLFEEREEFGEQESREEREFRYAYGRDSERKDKNRPWWQQTVAISAGLGVCVALAGYSLVQYTPALEQGLDSLAVAVQSKKNDFEISQSKKQQEQLELSQALSTPKPTPEVIETAPLIPAADNSKVDGEKLSPQNAPVTAMAQPSKEFEQALNPAEQGGEMPSIKPSARNYELLAFYSLVIGDLTQFRNAIKLAYQEDPSFDKLNTLNLSLHQLEVEKLSPEITLKALRSLVLQQYTERLLPSQLKALQAKVQDAQSVQNNQ